MRKTLKEILITGVTLPSIASAQNQYDLPVGVTEISEKVQGLHHTILIICAVVGFIVFGIMIWSIIFHRKSKGAKAAHFHESLKVEIIWTTIPFIILIAIAFPATILLKEMYDTDASELTIKITGSQWKWHYQYLNYGDQNLDIEFLSQVSTPTEQIYNLQQKSPNYLLEVDNPLVIPVDKKVRFLLTSDDVIHSWWVRDFAVKKDAIPGFINETWAKVKKIGTYRGQCAELCGMRHGFMPIVVEVKTQQHFASWLKQQQQKQQADRKQHQAETSKDYTKQELVALGEVVYNKHCLTCHQKDGLGIAGAFPPLKGSPIVTGPKRNHISTVLIGVKGTAMPAFAKQLSNKEVASVLSFERFSWGNQAKEMIQPMDVQVFLDALRTTKSTPDSSATTLVTTSASNSEQEKNTNEEQPAPTVDAVQQPLPESSDNGEALYLKHCAVCHQPTGLGLASVFPALKDNAIANGDKAIHINIAVFGVKGTAMIAFKNQLSAKQLALILTYERRSWGNTGTAVTEQDVINQIKANSKEQ